MTLWEWPNPAVSVLFYIFKIYPEPDHVVSSTWLLPWSEGGRHPPLPTATLSSPTWRWPLRLMPPHYTALLTGRKASVGTEQGPQYVPGPPDPQLPSSRHMSTSGSSHLQLPPLGRLSSGILASVNAPIHHPPRYPLSISIFPQKSPSQASLP